MKSYTGTGYSVYKHTNKTNGKVYIGITSNQDLTRRWHGGHGYKGCRYMQNAVKKYGWGNFTHEILFTGLTREEANAKECELIAFYNSTDPTHGYNIRTGGCDAYSISDEAREKLQKMFRGGNSPVARRVRVFKATGELVGVFDTQTEARNFIGCSAGMVSAVCTGAKASIKGYRCYYEDDIGEILHLPDDLIRPIGRVPTNQRPVSQYTEDGKYVKTYPSIKAAKEAFQGERGDITGALSKNPFHLTAYGFQWRYSDGTTNDIAPVQRKDTRSGNHYNAKAVVMCDRDTGNAIREFPSVTDAANYVNRSSTAIFLVLRGKNPTCAGYKWRLKVSP